MRFHTYGYWRLFPSPLYRVGNVRCIAVIITVTSPIEYNPGAMVYCHSSLNEYRLDEAKDGCGTSNITDTKEGRINFFIIIELLQ